MNWDAIGAVGEIVGALAVVVSLIYLATQIRNSTKVARAATRQSIAQSAEQLSSDFINNREMAELFVKHVSGEQLDPVENVRLQARCYRDMRHYENIHYQFGEGLLSRDQWLGFRKYLIALFEVEVYRSYWEYESELYSDAFREEMESILKESEKGKASAHVSERFGT